MKNLEIDLEKFDYYAGKISSVAHTLRISIIEMLEPENTKLSVTEVYTKLRLDQATASHHLRILKDKGLLGSVRDGKNILYYLKKDELNKTLELAEKLAAIK
ncbi:MAG: metalloregulator ArsR/SmtB family transcription factor [Bacteroidota bacterium]|nr:metalloregulator ArsR/SmtB family transcription factor [Bacteroidota bacterium]